jgi:hypothetical protein
VYVIRIAIPGRAGEKRVNVSQQLCAILVSRSAKRIVTSHDMRNRVESWVVASGGEEIKPAKVEAEASTPGPTVEAASTTRPAKSQTLCRFEFGDCFTFSSCSMACREPNRGWRQLHAQLEWQRLAAALSTCEAEATLFAFGCRLRACIKLHHHGEHQTSLRTF